MNWESILQEPWAMTAMFVFAVAGLIAFLAGLEKLYRFLQLKQGYVHEAKIEAVLLPVLYKAIFAVHETSEHALDLFGKELEKADKVELARITYNWLADTSIKVPGLPITVDVSDILTEDQWCQFVQKSFDQLIGWYHTAKAGLLKELEPPAV